MESGTRSRRGKRTILWGYKLTMDPCLTEVEKVPRLVLISTMICTLEDCQVRWNNYSSHYNTIQYLTYGGLYRALHDRQLKTYYNYTKLNAIILHSCKYYGVVWRPSLKTPIFMVFFVNTNVVTEIVHVCACMQHRLFTLRKLTVWFVFWCCLHCRCISYHNIVLSRSWRGG